jgi:hypothetical protein
MDCATLLAAVVVLGLTIGLAWELRLLQRAEHPQPDRRPTEHPEDTVMWPTASRRISTIRRTPPDTGASAHDRPAT